MEGTKSLRIGYCSQNGELIGLFRVPTSRDVSMIDPKAVICEAHDTLIALTKEDLDQLYERIGRE